MHAVRDNPRRNEGAEGAVVGKSGVPSGIRTGCPSQVKLLPSHSSMIQVLYRYHINPQNLLSYCYSFIALFVCVSRPCSKISGTSLVLRLCSTGSGSSNHRAHISLC